MFLYLMDGCDDWWKEIMQKGPLLVSSFAMEKEKESKAVALPTNENWDLSTAGGRTTNLILISPSGGGVAQSKILRVTTAPACTSPTTWSSP